MAFICDIHTGIRDAGDLGKEAKRLNLAYIAIGVAVLAGLFVPMSTKIVDVLVIFSLSLTAAVVLITLSAKTASEISGFDHLIRGTTILRSFLFVICCRLILTEGNTGIIMGFFNRKVVPDNMVIVILILPLLAGVVFTFICRAAMRVIRIAADFICNIAPLKHRHVEKELQEHVIDHKQAKALREIIRREGKFFVGLEKVSKYMFYDGIIEFVFILICLIGGMIIGTAGRTISGITTKTYIYLTFGAIITIQMPALVTAIAFNFLIQKNYLELGKNVKSEKPSARRINVVCSEVNGTEAIKSQFEERVSMRSFTKSNPAAEQKEGNDKHQYRQFRIFSEDVPITEELEWVDEEKSADKQITARLWTYKEIKNHYTAVAELLETRCDGQFKTILMGAESPKILPVTVPVNVAIQLAKDGQKCLLIDLDCKRDAIARVFELHKHILEENIPSKQTITGIPTCVGNLCLYPASWLTESSNGARKLEASKINQIITHLKIQYDYLIVYSPNLNKDHGCEPIGECIDGALLFGRDSSSLNKTFELLEGFECEILEPGQLPVKVS
jgi:Mrp family chromosome partitioning ATPase